MWMSHLLALGGGEGEGAAPLPQPTAQEGSQEWVAVLCTVYWGFQEYFFDGGYLISAQAGDFRDKTSIQIVTSM